MGIAHHNVDKSGQQIGQGGSPVGRFTAVNGTLSCGNAATELVARRMIIGVLAPALFPNPDGSRSSLDVLQMKALAANILPS
jgi:hypothetical protein